MDSVNEMKSFHSLFKEYWNIEKSMGVWYLVTLMWFHRNICGKFTFLFEGKNYEMNFYLDKEILGRAKSIWNNYVNIVECKIDLGRLCLGDMFLFVNKTSFNVLWADPTSSVTNHKPIYIYNMLTVLFCIGMFWKY